MTRRITICTAAFAAFAAMPAVAEAGCAPGVGSDKTGNTCIGRYALKANTNEFNTALGFGSLSANTSGSSNTATGAYSLNRNTTGARNTAAGIRSLNANTTGINNTATGASTLRKNTIGSSNTASGTASMQSNLNGSYNTAAGAESLAFNTKGSNNSAVGFQSLNANTTGDYNTAAGSYGLSANTVGSFNTAVGFLSLSNNRTGSGNIAIGYAAGADWTTGNNNIAIANAGEMGDTATIRIGVQGKQASTFIAGIQGVNVTGGQAVVVNASGQLGVISSSRRYKQDIAPMGDASDALMQLRPVTFRYKQAEEDGSRPLQYGLIAEEVAAVMPSLAIYDADGRPDSVAYQLLPSLLLNQYQKQARELAQAKAELADSNARLAALEAQMAAMNAALLKLAAAQPLWLQAAAAR